MPNNGRRYDDVLEGVEASRRVAWAKFYDEAEYAELLESLLWDLLDDVLAGKRIEAFARAYRIRLLFDHYRQERRR